MAEASSSEPSSGSPCCPPGSLPALLDDIDYKPRGENFELPAVPSRSSTCKVYIVGASHGESTDDDTPSSWKEKGPVLVMWCDVFGPLSGMHRKLADEFASRTGGIVLIPDPFEDAGGLVPNFRDEMDQPLQLGFNKFTWKFVTTFIHDGRGFLKRYPWETKHRFLMKDQLIPYLKSRGIDKFAMMGFCYGSWLIFKACNDEDIAEHVSCGIHYHPSSELLEKSSFGRDDIALCRTCKCPHLLHATKNESAKWKPNGAAHKALEENENVEEVQYTMAPKSQSHGFMTRADLKDEKSRDAVKEGVDLGVAFLKKYNDYNTTTTTSVDE